ncbi:class I SAM-dependent methyltransferase [Acidovorax sp. GBBC 3334]|uniref:class I SAM-dependent DNA methyltransferase n=1 Tax=unclassified Acidovorax TaxID=2684926 RepID=UPI002302E38D|nr:MULTISPECIES: class I SAM-dependent methyltransferase [unclassified Acidovorax]MDA8455710.1 class I SAM-dependent methyltransferase [Acidovorax sp. GBBC 3334]MDA8523230.1 class I SAM-dependent methyltransferase [Acidovorax sp. NCPPB 4044]
MTLRPADVRGPCGIAAPQFEALYEQSDDPWRFDGSWYEARKRRLLLASLPHERYARAFEPGCATGLLTAELAARCDSLLATDGADRALAIAARRLRPQHPHVSLARMWVPDEWPEGTFDLIVLSEFVYYLAPEAIDRLAQRVRGALAPDGVVAACHWRPPIAGCALAGDAVHERLAQQLALRRALQATDADFRLDVWTAGARSVAGIERRGD